MFFISKLLINSMNTYIEHLLYSQHCVGDKKEGCKGTKDMIPVFKKFVILSEVSSIG